MLVRQKKLVSFVVKVVVTLILLYVAFHGIEFDHLASNVLSASFSVVALAIAMQLLMNLLGALRWWLLARQAGLQAGFVAILPSYYLGVFCNLFLPTGVGGDLARVLHLQHRGENITGLIVSTVTDRMIGLTTVLVAGAIATGAIPEIGMGVGIRIALSLAAVAMITVSALLTTERFRSFLARRLERFNNERLRESLSLLPRYLQGGRWRVLLSVTIAISIMVQSLIVLSYYMLANDIGLHQPLTLYFAFVPIVLLVASVPFSLGGLGLREGAMVTLLTLAGSDRAQAAALSMIYLAVYLAAALPGAFALLTSSTKSAKVGIE